MDTGTCITQAYTRIKNALNAKLSANGYRMVHEQFNDPVYESRYVLWSNNADALRFTWDGKEGCFVLEVAHELPLSVLTRWDEIIDQPYDPVKNDTAYVNSICKAIMHTLE